MNNLDLKYKYLVTEMVDSLMETDTSFATNMELAIVETWNGQKLSVQKELAGPAKNVVAFLKKNRVNGSGQHLGRGFDKPVKITPVWSQWGGSNPTPKTDLMIGKHKFSLKTGPAQLMSGGKGETTATFYSALRGVKLSKTDKILVGKIESVLDKFVEGGYTDKGSVKANIESNKVLIAGDRAHKEMMTVLDDFFKSNPVFRTSFAQEAMSGETKFGQASPGHANWILNVSKDGNKNYLKKTNDKSYVGKVADAMRLSVRFKSTGEKKMIGGQKAKTGRYRFWSVVALGTGQLHEELQKYEGQVLTEGMMSKIWDKMKNFFRKIMDGVKRFIRQGVDYLVDFLQVEPEIKFNNIVNFASLG